MDNSTNSNWYDKTWLVVVLCILFFPVGLYALWKNEHIKKGWKIAVTIFIGLLVIAQISGNDKKDSKTISSSNVKEENEASKVIGIGQILSTQYFDIVVNNAEIKDRVNTGNPYANLKPEAGNKYLIIDASFKNTDNESRMLMDGSVWINYNGKNYEYDKSETIMLEGWGLLLDQINPLTTKRTKLVYKIPAEITGPVYWQPGRTSDDERIFLGKL
jgi:hypothetical protein